MFAGVLWAAFSIGLGCAWTRRWYIVLAAGVALSVSSFVGAIGYLGGISVFLLVARPRRSETARLP